MLAVSQPVLVRYRLRPTMSGFEQAMGKMRQVSGILAVIASMAQPRGKTGEGAHVHTKHSQATVKMHGKP